MRKPMIGIIGKVQQPAENDYWHHIDIVDEIRLMLHRSGANAIMLLPTQDTLSFNDNDVWDPTVLSEEELTDLYAQMDLCDGFVVQGGNVSCQYEIEIVKRAIAQDKPVLGICAGFNNILRALGTNIIEDETKAHSVYDINYRHPVTVVKGTKLHEFAGDTTLMVNSFHTMICPAENVTGYAKPSSFSEDGLVESIELENKTFVVGVKWHPEQMRDEPYAKALFQAFTDACR